MIQEHLDAVLARLRANSGLATIVFDEAVTGSSTKFVVVYTDTGRDLDPRMTGPTTRTDFTYTIHSVGESKRQAIWVADRVRAQLLNFKPTVEGRTCTRLQHPVSRPITDDKDSNPPLWYAVDQYDLTSFPA